MANSTSAWTAAAPAAEAGSSTSWELMTANSPASPEGSILTPNGWVTGKVEFAGHAISVIDGRTLAPGAKPKGPFVLPGFIDLHVHGGGGGDWQGGEEGVRTFVRYHTSY